jgi:hypothetical protein
VVWRYLDSYLEKTRTDERTRVRPASATVAYVRQFKSTDAVVTAIPNGVLCQLVNSMIEDGQKTYIRSIRECRTPLTPKPISVRIPVHTASAMPAATSKSVRVLTPALYAELRRSSTIVGDNSPYHLLTHYS